MPDAYKPREFPAVVVHVSEDDYNVVINRGSRDGIKKGQRFLIYNLSEEEILDPETNESLGKLETVRGTGIVDHVQEKMATIISNEYYPDTKTIKKPPRGAYGLAFASIYGVEETVDPGGPKPFENPQKGDLVKPI